MHLAVLTPQTSCQHTGPVSVDLTQGIDMGQQRFHLAGLVFHAWGTERLFKISPWCSCWFQASTGTKLLNLCLSTEVNSSRMLRPQGSCYSSRSCQGQISQPSKKHTHCLCSVVWMCEWSSRSVSARRNCSHNSPLRGVFNSW